MKQENAKLKNTRQFYYVLYTKIFVKKHSLTGEVGCIQKVEGGTFTGTFTSKIGQIFKLKGGNLHTNLWNGGPCSLCNVPTSMPLPMIIRQSPK